jgi:UDP-N-acetylmuramoyl-L-alanyl-D-glutamate--2,6-diaminopimelate ligase
VTLADALRAIESITVSASGLEAPTDRVIRAIAYDSRRVVPGALFVAVKGLKADGAEFAAQAVSRGALAVVAETPRPDAVETVWITVRDARLAVALLGAAFHGHPSRAMPVVGITGTNGKTTTAYLLAEMFEAAGVSTGLLGTVVYRVGRDEREASRTTPEGPDVQALLSEMRAAGCGACVMEVSSHALALRRVDGTRFAAGVFTNLTRDHLDFHADMEAYFAAKQRLFEMLPDEAPGVVNLDDPRGPVLTTICRRPVTYALTRPADVTAGPIEMTLTGLSFEADTPRGAIQVRSRLVGRPNASNILAAVATAQALDLPREAIERGLSLLHGVPGRFEVVSSPDDEVTVVVDYAHTDDALRNLLETARPLAPARLVTVFGCGGDRDRSKRPLMGMVAARLSDVVVITSDNPRTEDPQHIIDEIVRGIPAGPQGPGRTPVVLTLVDRAEAIARAVELAQPDDLVLVAGKGHEKYQQIGDRVLPFDDGQVARAALARRRGRRPRVG